MSSEPTLPAPQHLITGFNRSWSVRGILSFLNASLLLYIQFPPLMLHHEHCILRSSNLHEMILFFILVFCINFRLNATLGDVSYFFHPCSNVPYGNHTGSDDCTSGSSVSIRTEFSCLPPFKCWGS